MDQSEKGEKRRKQQLEEKARLLSQIDRGLVEIKQEMTKFQENYLRFLESGDVCETKIASWGRFFKDISLVSEDREEVS